MIGRALKTRASSACTEEAGDLGSSQDSASISFWGLERSFGGGFCWICAFEDLRFLTGVSGVDEEGLRAPAVFDLSGVAGAMVLGGGRYGVDGLRMPFVPLVVTILVVAMIADRKIFWIIRCFGAETLDRSLKLSDRGCKIENPMGEVVMWSVTLCEIDVITDARSE